MKKLILWAMPLVAMGLAGCEKSPASVGVSVDSTSSQVQEQGKSLGQEQSLNQSERASVTVKMPATTLLFRALDEYLADHNKKPTSEIWWFVLKTRHWPMSRERA